MIDQTIHDIEARIRAAGTLTAQQKNELQTLVGKLKEEVTRLGETHQDDADSIVAFARLATGEGLKVNKNPRLFQIALDGIHVSVEKFEATHPSLTMTVNGLSTYFSNLGI